MNMTEMGHDGKYWPQTIDSKVWADEFCRRNSASDNGTMMGWFANAIMTGYDAARRECECIPCCADFENCRKPCVQRAEYWKEQVKAKTFRLGDRVRKKSGAEWRGTIVGWYSTTLTPEGYAVESDSHPGSVQIYPVGTLQLIDGNSNSEG